MNEISLIITLFNLIKLNFHWKMELKTHMFLKKLWRLTQIDMFASD